MVTLAGEIHESAADFGYAGLIVAIMLLTVQFRRDERWRSYFTASSTLAVLGAGSSIFMGATSGSDLSGLSQRLMVVPLLLWVVFTALRMRSLPQTPAPEPGFRRPP